MFPPVLLVRCSWRTFSTAGEAVTQLLAWVWASHALGLATLPRLRSQIRQIWPLLSSRSECTIDQVLQMSRAPGWGYSLGSAVINQGCPDSCRRPLLSSLSQSDSQGLSPIESPAIPVGHGQRRGSNKAAHNAGGRASWSPCVLFSHWRNRRPRGDLSLCCELAWGRDNVRGQ